MYPAWHKVIPRPLRRTFIQRRRLNLQKSLTGKKLPHLRCHFTPQHEIPLQVGAAQIQIAVFETEIIFCFGIFLDREWRRLGFGQDPDLFCHDLNLSGLQIFVYSAGTPRHLTGDSSHKLAAQLCRFGKAFASHRTLFKDQLDDTGAVPQIHKNDASLIPALLHPAHDGYSLSGMFCP